MEEVSEQTEQINGRRKTNYSLKSIMLGSLFGAAITLGAVALSKVDNRKKLEKTISDLNTLGNKALQSIRKRMKTLRVEETDMSDAVEESKSDEKANLEKL